MTFTRLNRGDVLAMVAALALLLVMAMDWYTTAVGENARDVQGKIQPQLNRQTVPSLSAKEGEVADSQEKNAWQADGVIDRVLLIVLLAAVALAIGAGFVRAAGARPRPPSPSALASLAGLLAAMILVYRILQPPGLNAAAVVKAGAPLGLVCVGLLALGARIATLAERRAPAAEPAAAEEAAPAAPAS